MRKVLLGVGGNIGNRIEHFHQALQKLKKFGKISQTSFLYQTVPFYYKTDTNQELYLNAAVEFETTLSPEDLLRLCKDVESTGGRTSEHLQVWKGPRPIDIDILFDEKNIVDTPTLTIPHISIQERDFVLKPLCDIVPNLVHPILKKTIKELDAENDKNKSLSCNPERVWTISNPLTGQEMIFDFKKKTVGMGIINCTKDSIYIPEQGREKGSSIDYDGLEEQCLKFYKNGFDILDIGGESTRPGADIIEPEKEFERVSSMIQRIKANDHLKNMLISLDTRKSYVARKGIQLGATIVNDVSGGTYDEDMLDFVAENNIPYVIMHKRGTPQDMNLLNDYQNIMEETIKELDERVEAALKKGVYRWNIFVDPGIGVAKRREQNIEIFKNLEKFTQHYPYPSLLGFSEKQFIREITGQENTAYGNSVLTGIAIQKGAAMVRVHHPEIASSILFADSVYKDRKIYK